MAVSWAFLPRSPNNEPGRLVHLVKKLPRAQTATSCAWRLSRQPQALSAFVCVPLAMPVSCIANCLSSRRSDCVTTPDSEDSRWCTIRRSPASLRCFFRRFPLSISSSERRTDRRYSPAQSQLSLRIIAKDQLLNLAAELLPAESLRELIRHLDVISGIAEWDQIRFRRRRAILELAMRYFASSRLTTGMLVSPESLALHRFDLEQMERETGMRVAASSRTHPAPA